MMIFAHEHYHSPTSPGLSRQAVIGGARSKGVEDDGQGFDVDKLTQADPSSWDVRLFTIRERIRLAGGSCRIDSQPWQGTKVVVRIPVAEERRI